MLTSQQDLSKLKPINSRQTACSVNCIIMRIVDVLNEFGENAETTLRKAERNLRDAEIKLRLLEKKLQSVKLEDENEVIATTSKEIENNDELVEQEKPVEVQEPSSSISPPEPSESSSPSPKIGEILNRDDPRYAKYFKMLKMGVVEQAVILKMRAENVDPTILQKPDEVSTNPVEKQDSDSEFSSFSDSD
ncbi:unnamed protein product [Caenorhabditis angaria]|uniref:WASH complex subunit 3 n=1 Tax=Caenorhabditis angaria TaxID=860376 RepID=A0A9P1IBM3_9PELO|nr:unnamed protein product [Caenorhabditis angaria]